MRAKRTPPICRILFDNTIEPLWISFLFHCDSKKKISFIIYYTFFLLIKTYEYCLKVEEVPKKIVQDQVPLKYMLN